MKSGNAKRVDHRVRPTGVDHVGIPPTNHFSRFPNRNKQVRSSYFNHVLSPLSSARTITRACSAYGNAADARFPGLPLRRRRSAALTLKREFQIETATAGPVAEGPTRAPGNTGACPARAARLLAGLDVSGLSPSTKPALLVALRLQFPVPAPSRIDGDV